MADKEKVTLRLEFSIATFLFGSFMFAMGWFLCDLSQSLQWFLENLMFSTPGVC